MFNIDGEKSKSGLIFILYVSGFYGCYGLSFKLNGYDKFRGKVKYYFGDVFKFRKIKVMDEKSFNEYKRNV